MPQIISLIQHWYKFFLKSLKQNASTNLRKIDKNLEKPIWVKPYRPWYSFSKSIYTAGVVCVFYENW